MGDGRFGWHHWCDSLGHTSVQTHDVILGHFSQFTGGPRGQWEGLVAFPIGALEVEVGPQEGVNALSAMKHVVVGFTGGVVPLVVPAGRIQLREIVVHGINTSAGSAPRGSCSALGQRGWSTNWPAHNHGREHIGVDQAAPCGDDGTHIMPHNRRDRAVP